MVSNPSDLIHVGPFSEEVPTIQKVHAFIESESGLVVKHHADLSQRGTARRPCEVQNNHSPTDELMADKLSGGSTGICSLLPPFEFQRVSDNAGDRA